MGMKKWLKDKLRKWLFPDVIDLANHEINQLKVELKPYDKHLDLLSSAHRIKKESAFDHVIQQLLEHQIEISVTQAEDWQRVLFHRATINGFHLIKEEFERLDAEFNNAITPQEEFNKHDIV